MSNNGNTYSNIQALGQARIHLGNIYTSQDGSWVLVAAYGLGCASYAFGSRLWGSAFGTSRVQLPSFYIEFEDTQRNEVLLYYCDGQRFMEVDPWRRSQMVEKFGPMTIHRTVVASKRSEISGLWIKSHEVSAAEPKEQLASFRNWRYNGGAYNYSYIQSQSDGDQNLAVPLTRQPWLKRIVPQFYQRGELIPGEKLADHIDPTKDVGIIGELPLILALLLYSLPEQNPSYLMENYRLGTKFDLQVEDEDKIPDRFKCYPRSCRVTTYLDPRSKLAPQKLSRPSVKLGDMTENESNEFEQWKTEATEWLSALENGTLGPLVW